MLPREQPFPYPFHLTNSKLIVLAAQAKPLALVFPCPRLLQPHRRAIRQSLTVTRLGSGASSHPQVIFSPSQLASCHRGDKPRKRLCGSRVSSFGRRSLGSMLWDCGSTVPCNRGMWLQRPVHLTLVRKQGKRRGPEEPLSPSRTYPQRLYPTPESFHHYM